LEVFLLFNIRDIFESTYSVHSSVIEKIIQVENFCIKPRVINLITPTIAWIQIKHRYSMIIFTWHHKIY